MLGHRLADRYPRTPPGWTVIRATRSGRSPTAVEYRDANGDPVQWSSRFHRKHASRLSRGPRPRPCAVVGPAPRLVVDRGPLRDRVDLLPGRPVPGLRAARRLVRRRDQFFVGSIFFTSAALLQFLDRQRRPRGRRGPRALRLLTFEPASNRLVGDGIQFVGTLFFNVSTFRRCRSSTPRSTASSGRPTSTARSASSSPATSPTSGPRRRPLLGRADAGVADRGRQHAGSIAFGISAVAGYVVPSTGDVLALGAANFTTSFGALCFLIGAIMLLPKAAHPGAVSSRRRSSPAGAPRLAGAALLLERLAGVGDVVGERRRPARG